MTSKEIREKFVKFFENRGHKIISSSSLVPDDPSVLLTTAGMQQFKKYYTAELDPIKDFNSKNTVSIQKCFRTSDIDEVGDESHNTFFEMMGNFSFGGYFKKEAIECAFDFITKEMKLPISYVTIFEGSKTVPKDEESKEIWEKLGVKDIREEGMADVFWGPTGSGGPCGPTTEIYCKNSKGQDIEIWNIVFNEFFSTGSREELENGGAELNPLPFKGIDTGMGLERLTMIVQKTPTIFETDLFSKPFEQLFQSEITESHRIIADHLRSSIFLLSDGVRPSNKEAGYILRRLIRRLLVQSKTKLDIPLGYGVLSRFIKDAIGFYGEFYPELKKNEAEIINEFEDEEKRFNRTLDNGLREFQKCFPLQTIQDISGKDAFDLYQSYGLPLETIRDLAKENNQIVDEKGFNEEFKKHQEISRVGQEKKFGGHGLILNTGELKAGSEDEMKKVIKLHTATHLLQKALRDVLGDGVHQMGSDITPERTRFDFSFDRKLTPEEIKKVEEIVNQKIKEDLLVHFEEMSKEEAEKSGALHFFKDKYQGKVKVYFIGDSLENAWSKEFCGGPHVNKTGEIGNFKILKEEAVASGVRRIRGVL